ncbi:MAG: TonB-dependent receptor family protein [Runella sp.]
MKKATYLIFGLCSSICQAQMQPKDSVNLLTEVTIIGSRAWSLPGSGEIISPKKLALLNQPDVNKVLRIVPGVNIRDEEGFGLRPNIGLRGTPVNRSAKITIMEDGVLMAPAPYADPAAYYFPTMARMSGIEVLKGSSQIKHGPYTIGGAINLLSTPIPTSFQGFAQLSYGSFGTNQQRIWVGDSNQNFDYVFEVNRWASNGFKQLDGGGNTGFDRRDVMGKFRWHSAADAKIPQSLTFKFVNMTEDGNESYLGLTFEDFVANPYRRYAATQRDILDMKHTNLSLNHAINFTKKLGLTTTAYYANTFRDWARVNSIGGQSLNNILANPILHATPYQIMTGRANGNIVYQSAARDFNVRGIQSNLKFDFNTGSIEHSLQAGIRYHEDEADRYATQSTFAMTNGQMILTTAGVKGNNENQLRLANSMATYLNYEISYKGFTLSPGFRTENINLELQNFGNADNARLGNNLRTATNQLTVFLPGVGFNWDLNKTTHIFGGVHKGFSPPGMPSVTSITQAKTEKALNYELGYRFINDHFKTQIAAFLNDYQNILGSDAMSSGGLGTGDMFNAGRAKVQGLEMSVEYDLLSWSKNESKLKLPLNIAYTYTSAKFQETFINGGGDWGNGQINKGDFIPFITPHLFTGILTLEHPKFNVSLVSRFTGDTRTRPGQGERIIPADGVRYSDVNTIAQYWVFDVSANYRLCRSLSFYTMINNLFNKDYIVANLPQGYRPGMPLALNLGVKVEL